ncbi:hypothetical protein [Deinococcus cellulosilyticus]|uniref:Uncharacterized protein n=1 Tax=Deinococcus cellulosilyticus (strain DSM 18568 / NBRC 106333 / KACC 11606 / 5516J-15) TaxID=1223518 RepID=A0A511NB37_DEIC1|nr:hypothetical protein [Deinococcus cellulosilyticus]GEM50024.1 hypothetical protein DC3_56590 [Deinococcus cellulosilyticus NBRC 106333 = KACC 11606]
MNQIQLVREHLQAGLIAAGVQPGSILLQVPLGETFDGQTAASILTSLAPLEHVNRKASGTGTHARRVLWEARVRYTVEIATSIDLVATEMILNNLLVWLVNHKLNDPVNGEPITFDDPMQIQWVSGDGTLLPPTKVMVNFTVLVSIYNDTELVQLTVILQRRIAGGNPDE